MFSVIRYCLIAALLLPGIVTADADENNVIASQDISRIHRAADQLIRSQLSSGFFPYDFNFSNGAQSDITHMAGYNLVRQTGAAYSLAEYQAAFGGRATQEALERFLQLIAKTSLPIGKSSVQEFLEDIGLYNRWRLWGPLRKPLDTMGLLYSKEGDGKVAAVEGDYERAWTGATALSLLTAVKYYRATGDTQFNPLIFRLKNGLVALQVPGRGFRQAPHHLLESPYVNGETWLALAKYAESFPTDQGTLALLEQLDSYLLTRYGDKVNPPFFLWGTKAATIRAVSTNDPRFTDFLVKIVTYYMDALDSEPISETNTCAAVEGLATFVAFMKKQKRGTDPIVTRAVHFIEPMMIINRTLQINAKSTTVLTVEPQYISRLNKYQGAFIMSLQEPLMQVDLTQHCLNSLLQMEEAGLTL